MTNAEIRHTLNELRDRLENVRRLIEGLDQWQA